MYYTLIESEEDLSYLNRELLNKEVIGLDTEFRRKSNQDIKLSLLQISDGEEIFIVDCLEISGTVSNCGFLSSKSVTKIFHSFKEDIEAIKSWVDVEINNIFDTQLANAFLGKSFSISYKDLVKELFGISISKKETRSNWIRRPLSTSQLDYAASDVEFLMDLFFLQKKKLEKTNKYQFLLEETEIFSPLGRESEFSNELFITKLSKKEENNLLIEFEKLVKKVSETEGINSTLLFSKRSQKDFYRRVQSIGIKSSLKELPNWKQKLLFRGTLKLFEGLV